MNVVELNDKKTWNEFVAGHSDPAAFLQSWEFGEMESRKQTVIRFGVVDNEKIIAALQVVLKDLFLGKRYMSIERGPVVDLRFKNEDLRLKILETILDYFKKIARQDGVVFLRISLEDQVNFLKQLGFKEPKILTRLKSPQDTLLLNLKKSEEELLKAMHQKTRYNIGLSQRKGVIVHKFQTTHHSSETVEGTANNKSSFFAKFTAVRRQRLCRRYADKQINNNYKTQNTKLREFYDLLKQTSKRQGVKIFGMEHYQGILEMNSDDLSTEIFTAYYNDVPVAAAMVVFFGNTATYLHGGSSDAHKSVMAPYLLHWEIIRESKKRRCKWYDWWDVAPKIQIPNKFQINSKIKTQNTKQEWAGISRFKRRFGNEKTLYEIHYAPTMDLIYQSFWYNVLYIGKMLFKS